MVMSTAARKHPYSDKSATFLLVRIEYICKCSATFPEKICFPSEPFEVSVPVIKDYPVYDFKTEARIHVSY
jgi:hypothetical protein